MWLDAIFEWHFSQNCTRLLCCVRARAGDVLLLQDPTIVTNLASRLAVHDLYYVSRLGHVCIFNWPVGESAWVGGKNTTTFYSLHSFERHRVRFPSHRSGKKGVEKQ